MLPSTNRGAGGTFAMPDVCMTPAAPAPLPVPYPNFGFTAMSVPFSPNVLLTMVNAINMATSLLLTTGDEGGVAHPTFKGAARFSMGNPVVFIHMLPAIMLCALSTGNNFNAPLGATLIPSVVNVFFTRREADAFGPALDHTPGMLTIREFETMGPTHVYAKLNADRDAALLIDLRGCPGGVADAALQLADDFLPAGVVLAQRVDSDGDVVVLKGRRSQAYEMPVAVLVDEMTASAAEIFAGILQHHGRAKLFGSKTYGKGDAFRLTALMQGDDAPEQPAMAHAGSFRLPDGTPLSERLQPDVCTDAPEQAARAWLKSLS